MFQAFEKCFFHLSVITVCTALYVFPDCKKYRAFSYEDILLGDN